MSPHWQQWSPLSTDKRTRTDAVGNINLFPVTSQSRTHVKSGMLSCTYVNLVMTSEVNHELTTQAQACTRCDRILLMLPAATTATGDPSVEPVRSMSERRSTVESCAESANVLHWRCNTSCYKRRWANQSKKTNKNRKTHSMLTTWHSVHQRFKRVQ